MRDQAILHPAARRRAPTALGLVALAGGYGALALVTFQLAEAGSPVFFPAAGLTLAAFSLLPARWWPVAAAVVVATEISVDLQRGLSLGGAAAAAAANTLEPMLGALVLQRLNGRPPRLESLAHIRGLLVAVVAGSALGGAIGAAGLVATGLTESWPRAAFTWMVADGLGAIVLAPPLLLCGRTFRLFRASRRKLTMSVGALAALTGGLAIGLVEREAVVYVMVALVVWAAIVFKVEGAAVAGMIVAAAVVLDTVSGLGLFGDGALMTTEEELFLAILLVGCLLLGAEMAERHRLVAKLKANRASLQAVIDHSPLAIIEVSTRDWTVLRWNAAAETVLGSAEHEAVGRPSTLFDGPAGRDLRTLVLAGDVVEVETTATRRDGSQVLLVVSASTLRGDSGEPMRVVAMVQDATERRELERQLISEARHDALTGLANRASLLERLEHELRRQARHGGAVGVFDIDLDRFGALLRMLGRDEADRLLVEVAQRMRRVTRQTDTLARVAEDEFVMVADEVGSPRGAVEIAHRISAELAEPIAVAGRLVPVSASVGIALTENGRSTPEALLRQANAALMLARSRGPGRYELDDPDARTATAIRLDDEAALSRSLERDELRLVFQPKFDLQSGRIAGVEALARWNRDGTEIPPSMFVPLAEETGLIVPIGYWVLERACRRLAAWKATLGPMAPSTIAVNVSARQLVEPDFVKRVCRILERTGTAPDRLELEVTESVAFDAGGTGVETLRALRALGVTLAIDDFGTGYSSLSQLHSLPIDVVKIDRLFLAGLGSSRRDSAIVGAVITLAQSLGLRVVAEGVETAEQLSELVHLGCDLAQGFLLAAPISDRDLRERVWDGDVVRRHLPGPAAAAAA
ncbi:MAG: EAL domain-containing protein [Gaiella sp.]